MQRKPSLPCLWGILLFFCFLFPSGCRIQHPVYTEHEREAIEIVKVLRGIYDEVRFFDEKAQTLPEVLLAFLELNKVSGSLEYAIFLSSLPQDWLEEGKAGAGYHNGYTYSIVTDQETGVLALPMMQSEKKPRLFFARLQGGDYEHLFDGDLIRNLNAGASLTLDKSWKKIVMIK